MSAKILPEIVPAPAKMLLDFIRGIEAPAGYGSIYGNNQDKLAKPLIEMTVDEVIKAQSAWTKAFGSSAAGGVQFMRKTLIDIKKDTGLRGDLRFAAGLQDRLGYYLLLGRGYAKFIASEMSVTQFGLELAREWASFPVLAPCRGAKRALRRGDSYYLGDGINKVLVAPEKVEAKLRDVLDLAQMKPKHMPAPVPRPDHELSAAPPEADDKSGADTVSAGPASVDPEKLDKPLHKSKTFWQWLLTPIGAAVAAFGGLDWRVQLAIVAVIVLFAVYAIKRRADIAKVYRDIKAEIGA